MRGRKKKPIEKVESDSDKEIREANASGPNIKMEVSEVSPVKEPKKRRSAPHVQRTKSPKKTAIEIPPDMEGEGIQVKYTAEAVNGLEHIYPISHDMVLKIVNTL